MKKECGNHPKKSCFGCERQLSTFNYKYREKFGKLYEKGFRNKVQEEITSSIGQVQQN